MSVTSLQRLLQSYWRDPNPHIADIDLRQKTQVVMGKPSIDDAATLRHALPDVFAFR